MIKLPVNRDDFDSSKPSFAFNVFIGQLVGFYTVADSEPGRDIWRLCDPTPAFGWDGPEWLSEPQGSQIEAWEEMPAYCDCRYAALDLISRFPFSKIAQDWLGIVEIEIGDEHGRLIKIAGPKHQMPLLCCQAVLQFCGHKLNQ